MGRDGHTVDAPGTGLLSPGAGCALLSNLFADAARAGHSIPSQALRAIIPSYGMVSNPVDLTGNVINDMSQLGAVLDVLAAADGVDCIVIYIMGSLLDAAAPTLSTSASAPTSLIVALDPPQAQCVRRRSAPRRHGSVHRCAEAPLAGQHRHLPQMARGLCRADLDAADALLAVARVGGSDRRGRAAADARTRPRSSACWAMPAFPWCRKKSQPARTQRQRRRTGVHPVALKLLSNDIAHKSDIGGGVGPCRRKPGAQVAVDHGRRGERRPDARGRRGRASDGASTEFGGS